MTGLDRSQRYIVVCGELDPNTTYPNSDVGQCQAEEAETSSETVNDVDGYREKSSVPSYVIGKLSGISMHDPATLTSLVHFFNNSSAHLAISDMHCP